MARLADKFKKQALGAVGTAGKPGAEPSGASGAVGEAAADFPSLSPPRDTLTDLPLSQIEPDPHQPRQEMGDLSDLKASLLSVGVVQPIIVSILGYERYRLIAGERRFTAARELNLARIPAIVRTIEEHQRLELQIVENLHRKDLTPFEEAYSYQRLRDEFGLNQEMLGKRLGRSQESISELLRLLDLPARVQEEYRTSDKWAETVSKSLLLEIARSPAAAQSELWEQAKQGQLTVRKARETKTKSRLPAAGTDGSGAALPSAPVPFRHHIRTDQALVTVVFDRPHASAAEIITALEQALRDEKARAG